MRIHSLNCNHEPIDLQNLTMHHSRPTLAPDVHSLIHTPDMSSSWVHSGLQHCPRAGFTEGKFPNSNGRSRAEPTAIDCPSIQITAIPHNSLPKAEQGDTNGNGSQGILGSRLLDHLYLPLEHGFYRETSHNLSPTGSLSSRSCFSDASSIESYPYTGEDGEMELNDATSRVAFHSTSPHHSPLPSPEGSPSIRGFSDNGWPSIPPQNHHPVARRRSAGPVFRNCPPDEAYLHPPLLPQGPLSQPTSPRGKRRYSNADVFHQRSAMHASPEHSPTTSPIASPRGCIADEALPTSHHKVTDPTRDVPSKSRRTSEAAADGGSCQSADEQSLSQQTVKREHSRESFLCLPSIFPWEKSKPSGMTHAPIFRTSSLPPLDWQLPSQSGLCELKIEVEPKPHHRAHYETEGSRGAVKAASGGHPVVKLYGYNEKPLSLQLFIGTADERLLRPHAFYQMHRITGKAVSTSSQEAMLNSTKVLEVPLLPENDMQASIDCAGILKLRNSDIELRKGETDIGRKNTRVRLVFRTHIPQAHGKVLSLQVPSIPIECSQRSAQELPLVERQSTESCLVTGGEELVITGQNFTPDSKVIFVEKGLDGRNLWEAEGQVIREKAQPRRLVVVVPPYQDCAIMVPLRVHFHVHNGKRRRSQPQRFSYLPISAPPVMIKSEPCDDYYGSFGPSFTHDTGFLSHGPVGSYMGALNSPLHREPQSPAFTPFVPFLPTLPPPPHPQDGLPMAPQRSRYANCDSGDCHLCSDCVRPGADLFCPSHRGHPGLCQGPSFGPTSGHYGDGASLESPKYPPSYAAYSQTNNNFPQSPTPNGHPVPIKAYGDPTTYSRESHGSGTIKQEPMESAPRAQSITLDDVTEVLERDLSPS
uniref:nuclear factor of activated T-cells, cytoplasmic 3-like n=1 Tax=Myxine glutinosa TaxID=7769 RepID=UPI00358EB572